jgi:hypothetical protein
MKIVQPSWNLIAPCPCCAQGSLLIVACDSCGHLATECEKTNTFFPDLYKLEASESHQCSECKGNTFSAATSAQIQKAGLDHSLYV